MPRKMSDPDKRKARATMLRSAANRYEAEHRKSMIRVAQATAKPSSVVRMPRFSFLKDTE